MGRAGRTRAEARHPSFPPVVVVEPRPMVGRSIAASLSADGIRARHCPLDRAEALREVCGSEAPAIGIVGMTVDAAAAALDVIESLSDAGAACLALRDEGVDEITVAEAVAAGACGVISTAERLASLEDALQALARGDDPLPLARRYALEDVLRAHRRDLSARLERLGTLTPREAEVLAGLIDGKRAEQIAEESFVALCTVRSQIKSILCKLGVHSQLEAVAAANRAHWTAAAG